MIWLQYASSFCTLSCRHSDRTEGAPWKQCLQLRKWTALMELFSSHLWPYRGLHIKSLHLNRNHLISHMFFFYTNHQCEQLNSLIFRWQAHALTHLTNSCWWCLKIFFMHGGQHGRCIRSSALPSRALQAWQWPGGGERGERRCGNIITGYQI